jgi:hypothetical protein
MKTPDPKCLDPYTPVLRLFGVGAMALDCYNTA